MKQPKPRPVGRPVEIMVETIRKTYNIEQDQADWIRHEALMIGWTDSQMMRLILFCIRMKIEYNRKDYI